MPSVTQWYRSARYVARRLADLVISEWQGVAYGELTGNLWKAELQHLNFSQVLMGVVKSFLFRR